MKKVLTTLAAVAAASMTVSSTWAAEATVGVDINSAYVFRGVTLNDGFVAQPYLEVSGLPIDIGVWGNLDMDDYDGALEGGQFSEIDIYGSYAIPVEGVDASIGYTEYTYPNGGEADREIGLTVGAPEGTIASPYLSLYYGLDGAIDSSLYIEAGIGHEMELDEGLVLGLGALVGYLSPDEGDDGFHQYEVSASLSYDILTAGVKYIGQLDDDVLADVEDGGGYDVEFVGTIGLSYGF